MALRRQRECDDVVSGDMIQPQIKTRCTTSTRSEVGQHPHSTLQEMASDWNLDITDQLFAQKLDEADNLSHFRQMFCFPKNGTLPMTDPELVDMDEDCIYFCGNSLGLMPKRVLETVKRETDKWAHMGVHGHMNGDMPWALCDEHLREQSAKLVGAKTEEVVIMNALTVNLHLAMISFYKPSPKRYKILLESKAFPSDHYCIESQIELRGFNPRESMICMEPREGEQTLRTEDILRLLEEQGEEIALVLFPGVQYYTGQLFDMEKITRTAHRMGCMVGFDLAHAVGNVEMSLHNWDVDFAAWCNYKYMNSGAGAVGGLFIHEKHNSKRLHRLTGWWSHKMDTRFNMDNELELTEGPLGYRISNPAMFLAASLESSLEVFSKTSMAELCSKSRLLTGYLEMLMLHHFPKPTEGSANRPYVTILTPSDPKARGCQLSVQFSLHVTSVFDKLETYGVVCDKRKPAVLRLAPAPLYNSFTDVYKFITILQTCLDEVWEKENISEH